MRANGMVRITHIYHKGGRPSSGTAHVHLYATSCITNELEARGTDPADCTLVVQEERPTPQIVFEYATGPKAGRKIIFEPSGDKVGWDEMVKFAKALQAAWAIGMTLSYYRD